VKTIAYTAAAAKQMLRLDRQTAQRVRAKLAQYAADPASVAGQVKAMRGMDALRLRVGDYRVVFTDDGLVLMVVKVGHRREVYR
jgi:mRNA interferase RelE/StbE